MQFEAGSTYKTRDGRSVRIVCDDRKHATHTLLGLVDSGGTEDVVNFRADGKYYNADDVESPMDLVLPPREFLVTVFIDGSAAISCPAGSVEYRGHGGTKPEYLLVREAREGE